MPYLSTTALDRAMDAIGVTTLSLHLFFSATGDFEVTGGGYARQPVAFPFASASGLYGSFDPDFLLNIAQFSVPGGSTVNFIGLWDDADVFLGMVPLTSSGVFPCTLGVDLTTLTYQHTLVLNEFVNVVMWNAELQIPIAAEGNIYYPVNVTTTTTQLAASFGGTPLVFLNQGGGYLQIIQPKIFFSPGTLSIGSVFISPFAVS